VVAATNRNLQEAITEGKFREDLYYRLNVASLRIPPLRDRVEDILPLARHFIQQFSAGLGKPVMHLTDSAADIMEQHEWKGNVRELRNVIERIVLLEDGEEIKPEHIEFIAPFSRSVLPTASAGGDRIRIPAEGIVLDKVEQQLIEQALDMTGGNQVRAAKLLGLTRGTLRYRLDKYGITLDAKK
jgi:two-component system NtrC family response regulator